MQLALAAFMHHCCHILLAPALTCLQSAVADPRAEVDYWSTGRIFSFPPLLIHPPFPVSIPDPRETCMHIWCKPIFRTL